MRWPHEMSQGAGRLSGVASRDARRVHDSRAEDSTRRHGTSTISHEGHRPAILDAVAPIRKALVFGSSLFLFVLAILLMKEGARTIAPLVDARLSLQGALDGLGFGWLMSYVILSGSPVAATALAFLDAGIVSRLSAFTMITGSRIGAGFIVLLLGFVYVLRGRDREVSLGMGLLSLLVTGSTYLLAMVVGVFLLNAGWLDRFQPAPRTVLVSAVDGLFGPIVVTITDVAPGWALFPIGLAAIMASFHAFDRCLPEMTLRESRVGRVSRFVYRRWVMFALGAGITLVSMSVSVSLGILVPLSHRGYVRRENVIPYIMGANIATFIDTLIAAVLIGNAVAFTVVLCEVVSVALVSAAILAVCYASYERTMLAGVSWVTATRRHTVAFLVVMVAVPLGLVLL